jgi:hypothetical protein
VRNARRLGIAALALVVCVGFTACGDDDGAGPVVPATNDPDRENQGTSTTSDGSTTSTTADPATLPPAKALDLEPLYGEALAALGMRLTDRGGLIDRSGGGYVASATGTHLALYVEPIGDDRTPEEYVEGILAVAKVFSDIYDRWPGLATYDVCQEPPDPDGTQQPEPLPVTQIELTRAESDAIDWDTVTLAEFIALGNADPPEYALRVGADLTADPAYQEFLDDAEDRRSPYP